MASPAQSRDIAIPIVIAGEMKSSMSLSRAKIHVTKGVAQLGTRQLSRSIPVILFQKSRSSLSAYLESGGSASILTQTGAERSACLDSIGCLGLPPRRRTPKGLAIAIPVHLVNIASTSPRDARCPFCQKHVEI